ncbi:PREDICTED: general odorant-binding protein 72 [Dinoponera quadriceps]|uniref:General odorant-binding protein 72 n=1 Tax=Dinoponera quadriceps TaxID=609295 RepID=A0A6P3XUI5_DINQU|nr:PREDICTED: general odorant-binding protein 72 [Dinoponera quadriceps]
MPGETCGRALICALVIALVAVDQANAVMSMEQIQKTAATIRNTCAGKVSADIDVVLGIQKGEYPDDPKLKCYTLCVMKTMRSFKNGRVDDGMMTKQVDMMMPADLAGFLKESIGVCASEPPTGDDCETTFNFVKCMYRTDSEHFFFP